jgi:hypothetical protein
MNILAGLLRLIHQELIFPVCYDESQRHQEAVFSSFFPDSASFDE